MKELNDYKYALDESAIVAITDQKGTIIHANDNFCKISKYEREELIGQDHRIINSGFHSKEFIKDLWVTIANGRIWRGELKNRAKDGSVYWVDTTIVPFLNEENKPFRYVAIRADITQRKQVEEELLKYSTALEHQNTQLVDFCNIVSHNLRGPILNISMLVDYIEKSSNLEKQLEAMSKIKPVINHLMEVFNELVESIQIKQDTGVVSEYIEFEECCEKVLRGFEVQIKEYQADIEMDFSAERRIHFPQKYLDSIFTNLISNALKYRSPDRPPKIGIKTEKLVDGILLSVSDNGLGIDLEMHRDKIFKIRKVFHKHPEAKGFGLFMLKTQVEATGGSVWVDSKPDVGSTFFVKLINQRP